MEILHFYFYQKLIIKYYPSVFLLADFLAVNKISFYSSNPYNIFLNLDGIFVIEYIARIIFYFLNVFSINHENYFILQVSLWFFILPIDINSMNAYVCVHLILVFIMLNLYFQTHRSYGYWTHQEKKMQSHAWFMGG